MLVILLIGFGKVLAQGLQLLERFRQLEEKYNSHKQVSNIKFEIYLLHLIVFKKKYILVSLL